MINQLFNTPKTLLVTLVSTLLATGQVIAQEETQNDEQEEKLEFKEIVVTATKRAQSAQDVPISILATSGEQIQDMAITRAEELFTSMPAITIAQNPIGNFVFIRGIGTPGSNQGIEQSVSVFHDSIYMGRHQLSRAPFMDIQRVEVLRGPQSVMFGKNTIGGAIHVIAAKPSYEFEGMVSGMYGDYGETEFNAVLSGPFSESLRGRLSVRQYGMDGYMTNVMNGEDGPYRDDKTVRAQLEFDATDNMTVGFKWENSEFSQKQQATQLSIFDPFTAGAAGVSGLNQLLVATATGGDGVETYDTERAVINDGGVLLGSVVPLFAGLPGFPNLEEFSDNEMDVGTMTIDWDIGDHTLTAITGYASYQYRDVCDCDFSALPLIQVDAAEDYDQFSQEIRLTSPVSDSFDYIIGAYFHNSDLKYTSRESFGAAMAYTQVGVPTPLLVPNLTRDYAFNQDQEMWAVFGSGTWHLSDVTRLTVGLRYQDESKEVDHVLHKLFTGGWDYSALAAVPAGTLAFGDTAADYDAFLASGWGNTDLGGGVTPGFLTEAVFAGLLGTFEHDIRGRTRDESSVDWSATLEHELSADSLGYITMATGTKGGGFDARFLQVNDNPFFEYEEEKATNIELGFKNTLLDGAMALNVSAFYTTVDDFQVSIFDGATAFFVDNVAEVETRGLEMDMNWAVNDNWTVRMAASYLNAEYSKFEGAPCWAGTAENNRGDCINRGLSIAGRDASGEQINFAPDFSGYLNFNYHQEIFDNLEWRATLNLSYSADYKVAADLDPVYAYQEAFTKVDLHLAIGDFDAGWEIALIGKNLTDEYFGYNSNDQPLVPGNGFAQLSPVRTYAIQATYNFY